MPAFGDRVQPETSERTLCRPEITREIHAVEQVLSRPFATTALRTSS